MSFGYKAARFMFNVFSANRQEFYEDFASALRDEAAPNERLKKMAAKSRQRKTGWAPLYEHWLRKMRRVSFAHALQNTVPAYEVMVLTAAEESARLDEAMEHLSRAIGVQGEIKSAYFMSLISPIFATVAVLGFLVGYAVFIGPQNLESLPIEKWPDITVMLYAVSNALVDRWYLFAAAAGLTMIAVRWSRPNWRGRVRSVVDSLPLLPWKSYRENESHNFLVSLAILLQSNNHGMKEALLRMRQFASPWLGWHITQMLKRLALTPEMPARALDTGLFTNRVMDRIEDYSERSEFYVALQKLAFDHADKNVKAALRRAVVSGFAAMAIVAAVMGVIILSSMEFSQAQDAYVRSIH